MGLVIGCGAAAMLAAGAFILWRPWGHSVSTGDVATTPAHSTENATVTVTEATTSPPPLAPTKPGQGDVTPAKPVERAAPTDSASHDQVIAASPANFNSDVPVPAADLDLGAEVATGPTVAAIAPSELARRLELAEKQAQQELAGRLSSFQNVLVASRLGSSEGVSQARIAWNNGAEAIRQYRAKVARLEQTCEDSVLASQRAKRWSAGEMRGWAVHQSLAEPTEVSQLADLMLSQVAEGFDILAALDGQYEVKDGTLRFKNPASGTRYLGIRTWVEQRMQSWNSTPEGARPATVTLILHALGDGFPPAE
jgi:hypothetical protein